MARPRDDRGPGEEGPPNARCRRTSSRKCALALAPLDRDSRRDVGTGARVDRGLSPGLRDPLRPVHCPSYSTRRTPGAEPIRGEVADNAELFWKRLRWVCSPDIGRSEDEPLARGRTER